MLLIPKPLLDTLHEVRKGQLQWPSLSGFARDHPVVFLTPGLRGERFLTFDGRVLKRTWNDADPGAYETTDIKDIAPALVICAREQGLPELLDLLPPIPPDGIVCPECLGQRAWLPDFEDREIVCPDCHGLGWQHTKPESNPT
jgi:hypothetical protein